MNRHKTKWTYVSLGGGKILFDCEEDARSYALTYGGHGTYPPLYGDD